MPKTKKTETEKPNNPEGVLEQAAKAIGSAVGTIAAKTGIAHANASPTQPKAGKLPKKNKSRLPRRQKKAAMKKAARSA